MPKLPVAFAQQSCFVYGGHWTSVIEHVTILHSNGREAVKMEATLSSSRADGGIRMAFECVVSAERKAMIGALKCMYFLNKREIAHTTNFIPLCELGKSLGVKYLEDLQRGGNAHYTSERFKLLKLLLSQFKIIFAPHPSFLCA